MLNDKGNVSDGYNILFYVCHVLNSAVWPDLRNKINEDKTKLKLQLNAIREIYEKYKSITIFTSTSLESLQNGYTEFVCYGYHYFDIDNVNPADLWPELCGKTNHVANRTM